MCDRACAQLREQLGIGVAITLPDFNEVLAKLGGRLLPFGWLTALRARRQVGTVRVWTLGVKPEFQHTGVAAGLYAEHFRMASSTNQTGGEMGWILETNTAMNRGMEAMGGRVVKRYRLFERVLGEAGDGHVMAPGEGGDGLRAPR